MSTKVKSRGAVTRSDAVPAAWTELLRGHAALTRQMDATLRELHGLSLNEYEVLLQLRRAPHGRLRRVDLAQRLVVTQGGITRLLAVMEGRGLVERASCAEDARVVYACLTEAGRRKLDEAADTHLDDVRRLFSQRFNGPELRHLSELLSRLRQAGAAEDYG